VLVARLCRKDFNVSTVRGLDILVLKEGAIDQVLRRLTEIRSNDHLSVRIAGVPLIIGSQKSPSTIFITPALASVGDTHGPSVLPYPSCASWPGATARPLAPSSALARP
jgi:hypothetical protein